MSHHHHHHNDHSHHLPGGAAQSHAHHHGAGGHSHRTGIGRLAVARFGAKPLHRVGRRQFLTDLGRSTFAVAILGAGVAACSDSDSVASDSTTSRDATPRTSDSASATTGSADSTATTTVDTTDGGDPTGELRWSQVNFGFVSAYVLVRGNEAAVVDTGVSGNEDQIGEALATMGVGYDAVSHVILTHDHGDHIGSLAGVLERASGATAYVGEGDLNDVGVANVQAVGNGDDVFGLEVIETPGHTPGSISVLDTGIGLLVAGDALNTNADGSEVSGPNEDFTSDLDSALDSVRTLAEREFETLLVGHGNPVESGAGAAVAALADSL